MAATRTMYADLAERGTTPELRELGAALVRSLDGDYDADELRALAERACESLEAGDD